MLREQRRQAYLEAMGISVLYPRCALPGARPSPRYELPQVMPATPPEKGAPKSDGAVRPTRRKPPQSDRRSEAGVAGAAPEEVSAASKPASQPTATAAQSEGSQAEQVPEAESEEQALHFTLAWYPISTELAVICEMPQHASRGLMDNSLGLLQAILRALLIDVDLKGLPRAQLQWPLHDGMSAQEASSKHAALALSGFITNHLEQRQANNLLVFGEQIGELLPGAQIAGAVADYPLHSMGLHITRLNSLSAMLSMPELKRECWRDLQVLRQRLQQAH